MTDEGCFADKQTDGRTLVIVGSISRLKTKHLFTKLKLENSKTLVEN